MRQAQGLRRVVVLRHVQRTILMYPQRFDEGAGFGRGVSGCEGGAVGSRGVPRFRISPPLLVAVRHEAAFAETEGFYLVMFAVLVVRATRAEWPVR